MEPFMNKTNFIFKCFLVISLPFQIWGQTTVNTNQHNQTQVDITSAKINSWLRDVVSKPAPGQYNIADYKKMTPIFNNALAQALAKFEQALKEQILPPLMNELEIYNRIYNSKQFEENQKNRSLSLIFDRLMAKSADASKQFQDEVSNILVAVNSPHLITIASTGLRNRSLECNASIYDPSTKLFKIVKVYISGRNDSVCKWDMLLNARTSVSDDFFPKIKASVYKTILSVENNECRSELCVSLRAHDMLKVLSFIINEINKDIILKTADNREIKVSAINFEKSFDRKDQPSFRAEFVLPPFKGENKMFFDATDFPINFSQDTE